MELLVSVYVCGAWRPLLELLASTSTSLCRSPPPTFFIHSIDNSTGKSLLLNVISAVQMAMQHFFTDDNRDVRLLHCVSQQSLTTALYQQQFGVSALVLLNFIDRFETEATMEALKVVL